MTLFDINVGTIIVLMVTQMVSATVGTVVGIIIARYFPKLLDHVEKGVQKVQKVIKNGNGKHS